MHALDASEGTISAGIILRDYPNRRSECCCRPSTLADVDWILPVASFF